MNTSKKKPEIIRYDKNPFIENMTIPIKGKQVQLSPMGKDDNILVNQSTGEVHGTHVTTYKKVDSEQFVKIFTENIALTFGLKTAGLKAFAILTWAIQEKGMSKDLIPIDKYVLEEFMEKNKNTTTSNKDDKTKHYINKRILLRGLSELEECKIIAKGIRQGWYYINPNFIFNGNRIAFTRLFEREGEKGNREEQQEIENLNI